MKREEPYCGAVFERHSVVPSDIKAWVVWFEFNCNGVPYGYCFAIGSLQLTEQQAHDIMVSRRYIDEARAMFLRDVVIPPVIN